MPSFNLDLIYGAVGTIDDWRATVEAALAFDPPHISAYGLTVEAGTPLASQPDRHPDDDDQADKYELVDDLLAAGGLQNYELSNWARPATNRDTTICTGTRPTTGGSVRRSFPRGRAPLVEPAHARSLHRGDQPAGDGRRIVGDPRCRHPPVRGPPARARTRNGVERSAFSEDTLELLEDMVVPHPSDPTRAVLPAAAG